MDWIDVTSELEALYADCISFINNEFLRRNHYSTVNCQGLKTVFCYRNIKRVFDTPELCISTKYEERNLKYRYLWFSEEDKEIVMRCYNMLIELGRFEDDQLEGLFADITKRIRDSVWVS